MNRVTITEQENELQLEVDKQEENLKENNDSSIESDSPITETMFASQDVRIT